MYFYLLECWDGEPDNRPLMHEVVKRLKAIILQSNATIYQQQNEISDQINEKPTLNSIEVSSHGKLSQLINNFHKMNTNEIESIISTNEQMINESISSKN